MLTIDFGRSYLRFRVDLVAQPGITFSHKPPTTVNNVRINVDCVTTLTHRSTGKATVYALGASCKTERVGADRDLWLQPNADFKLVLGGDEFLIIKSWQKKDMGVKRFPETLGVQPERQIGNPAEAWVASAVDIRRVPGRELPTVEQIIPGITGTNPLISHTEYDDAEYHVTIDHPVKTINYSEKEGVFQTDTGPVLLPDLGAARRKSEPSLIGCLDLAYSAFNAAGWAEFVINAPTALADGLAVNHYSKMRRVDGCRNAIIETV